MGKDLKGKEIGKGFVQKASGSYEARYVDRFGNRKSITGKDLKDVRRRYNEAIYEDEHEINIRENYSLDEWYNAWLNLYKIDEIRPNTLIRYKTLYRKHIASVLGKMKLSKITQLEIRKLLKNMKKAELGYETRNAVKIMLVDMFDKALIDDFVRKNPAKGITIKRDEEKEIKVLTVEEQALFFDCCKGTFYDNFFITAVATGMRIGEIAALREEDIDFDKKVIRVSRTLVYAKYEEDTQKTFHFEDPKTKTSNRAIPINKQCFMALKKQIMQKRIVTNKAPKSKMPEQQFRNLIFTTSFNTPINSQIIMDAIKKIVNEINLTRDPLEEMELFSCHAFRHTFATRCFEAGIKPKTVQAYLGHASLQMTMDLYTSVLPEHLSNEMEKLEERIDELEEEGRKLLEKKTNIINFSA